MKTVLKKYWPLLSLAAVLLIVLLIFLLLQLRSTPEKAVEGYIRASLQYDADGLLRYASEYQITALGGNTEVDLDALRELLKQNYEQAAEYRETGRITFESEVSERVEKGSARFEELLTEYAYKGDPEKVDGFAVVTSKCYVDGKLKKTYYAVAVKCGGKWYYGFIMYA